MDNPESKGRSTGGLVIAAVIVFIALAALVGAFRPQLAQAWSSLNGPSQAQEEAVRAAVERYAEAQDVADSEYAKVKARLNGGIVTERYWSSKEGEDITEGANDDWKSLHLARNQWLAGWSLEECCPDGTARGVAEIGSDWRIYDLEQAPEDLSTPFLEGTYKTGVELVVQVGGWKIAWVEEIKDKDGDG